MEKVEKVDFFSKKWKKSEKWKKVEKVEKVDDLTPCIYTRAMYNIHHIFIQTLQGTLCPSSNAILAILAIFRFEDGQDGQDGLDELLRPILKKNPF